jgi:hypothetical protein
VPFNARAKGSGFERQVAKFVLTTFNQYGYHFTKKDCYRTPLSGGHRFAREADPGDLVLSPELRRLFPFCVEAKFYHSISLHDLMDKVVRPKCPISKWWKQATNANNTTEAATAALLVFKQNHGAVMCMFDASLAVRGHVCPIIDTRVNGMRVIVCRFDQFVEFYATRKK